MAWYYGTYSCGCEGRTQVYGATKDRQRIADYRFEGLCPECWKKQQEEKRTKENAEAAEKSAEMALPDLTGTVKQIAWACSIRLQKIESLSKGADRQIKKIEESPKNADKKPIGIAMVKNALNWFIQQHTTASYWIDNRDAMFLIGEIISDYAKTVDGAAMMAAMTGNTAATETAATEMAETEMAETEMAEVKTVETKTTETTPNKKVVKRTYDKSKIMKRAWELKRTTDNTFSICLKKSWAEAKAPASAQSAQDRVINRRIYYSVFKSIKKLAEGVHIEKGEYHVEDKTIDIIITFNEFFLQDLSDILFKDSELVKTNAELLNKFNQTKDENIVFSEEIRKMAVDAGITSNFILQNYCDMKSDRFIEKAIKRDEELGRTSHVNDFKKLQEIRKNIFCVEI